jgi:ABC-type multidrug transport system ATPase subunit
MVIPHIILEPTSGLDSFNALNIVSILEDLARREKKTIIMSIHSPGYDIMQMIDRLLLIHNG